MIMTIRCRSSLRLKLIVESLVGEAVIKDQSPIYNKQS